MSVAVHTIELAPRSHEEEFIRRYEFLFCRCLHLTKKKDLAEDILHDGFVQFTINRPDLGSIEDLDGYLCRLLRNLYYARLRLATWSPKNNLSLIDYDSANHTLVLDNWRFLHGRSGGDGKDTDNRLLHRVLVADRR